MCAPQYCKHLCSVLYSSVHTWRVCPLSARRPYTRIKVCWCMRIALTHMRRRGPFETSPDGNCLVHSVSRALFGTEKYMSLLRRLTTEEIEEVGLQRCYAICILCY